MKLRIRGDSIRLGLQKSEVCTKIFIEKDYQCINPNRIWPDDESDAFPNLHPFSVGASIL